MVNVKFFDLGGAGGHNCFLIKALGRHLKIHDSTSADACNVAGWPR